MVRGMTWGRPARCEWSERSVTIVDVRGLMSPRGKDQADHKSVTGILDDAI